ncbi:50S ribosomal protein L25 [Candidatus Kaiserbacteria bacterium]|nr:50S ribosomal protein L25 [Candidatus Kaiserbacteria bacterium]
MLALEVKQRGKESADTLRKAGIVPAVFYGPKEKATSIAVDERHLEHIWKKAGETTIVTLKGIGEDKDTLIHDAQFHPVTGKLLHVDFYVLEKGKKVRIKVPIEFTGAAPAEKLGHIIVKTLHEVEIEVAPQELPHSLTVDLGTLENVGDHIVTHNIVLPASAVLVTSPEEIVVSVKEFKEEPVEVAPAPETVIIGEEKAVEEGAPEGAEAAKKQEAKKEEPKREAK